MLEIDVDVGWLAPFFGQEACEEKIVGDRVDRSDFEQIADERIRRRTAPLAQDGRVLRAGEIDDVVDGQKIAGEIAFADEGKLLVEHLPPTLWQSDRKSTRLNSS